ncbi:MAG: DNA mismatch repair endonuclease MutL [Oscillospiraceae bacterium]|nr:DNA mismatch repair endonuclease MutL [Oscillospiraceae bacterium]
MAKIREMPAHLADLIAAGEVVERPSSVVKELVENSIDAGADTVTVEIQSGGMALIRVSDNGCGMSPEDAETAFLRHATSKLYDERGLEAIGTLGFRGEALAAISSVSRVELLTKERDADTGTRIMLEAGKVVEKEPAGAPDGTTMIIRDLFFNTPARRKYMKSDKAEGTNVSTVVTRLALSRPDVSIRFIKDGKEELHTPGDGRIDSVVYSTLGREFAKSLLKAERGDDRLRVSGYISSPAGSRGNRAWQFFFINGRFVKSKLMQAALEQGYKNSLFTGRFPVCVLDIDMPLTAVDVNVHPTKTEVRFENEREVFDAVYWAVRSALDNEDKPAELKISPATISKIENGYREAPRSAPAPAYEAPKSSPAPEKTFKSADFYRAAAQNTYKTSYSAPQTAFRTSFPGLGEAKKPLEVHDSAFDSLQESFAMPAEKPIIAPDAPIREPKREYQWRYVGETMNTYLIVEKGESLYLIDKHAAHERVLFDRLKEKAVKPDSQMLITPLICPVGAENAEIIIESAALLAEFGFEVEEFGEDSVALRQVPADVDIDEPERFMEEIADKLRKGGRREIETLRDDLRHTVACKAAIKAGRPSEPESVYELIDRVMRGEVRYCPHGRPVAMELTKYQLDKNFRRV